VDGPRNNINAVLVDTRRLNVGWSGDSIRRRMKMRVSSRSRILVLMAIPPQIDCSSVSIVDVVVVGRTPSHIDPSFVGWADTIGEM